MTSSTAFVVLGRRGDRIDLALLDAECRQTDRLDLAATDWPERARALETTCRPRWVWNDAPQWYPALLDAGIRLARCHDLRLNHAILRTSALVPASAAVRASDEWDAPGVQHDDTPLPVALFEWDAPAAGACPAGLDEALAEFSRQREAIDISTDPGRLRLLSAAESAGALVAAELRAAGLPWDAGMHDGILREILGDRPASGALPVKMADAAARTRAALEDERLQLDSPPRVLRALHRRGVLVQSTSRWELSEHTHPAIEPLLEYKRLARLMSANGWSWLAEWVHDGRFRPVYIPAGVVTGRWASSGGGALQIPRQLRAAVRADAGWTFVIADVAQLEPRVLAALARDTALADAARGRDLYAGIAEAGTVGTRDEAKIAILGAMYGATTGDSGRLVPRLRRAYPRAMGLVDHAAQVGEDGGSVSTLLGRSTPPPDGSWSAAQSDATEAGASDVDQTRARRHARDRGRFTRNFVVQGTAAEWALAWLADLRTRLAEIPPVAEDASAPRSGPVFSRHPHLAYFLHDEVIVHTPLARAEEAAHAVSDAADAAGRLLFGDFPIDFRLDVRISDTAGKG